MKNYISPLYIVIISFFMMACQSEDARSASLQGDACPGKNATAPADNEQSNITMNLKVNNSTMKVKLSDNAATKALVERLKEGAITYNAHDYGGFEKVGALGFSLPSNDTYITTEPGDIMLYTSNQLCIFFDSNSWEYTPIGKIDGMTKQQLKDAFGTGEVSITLSLDNSTGVASISANFF